MVKAVNIDESPNTLGNPPKKSNSEEVTIINPEDDVRSKQKNAKLLNCYTVFSNDCD